MVPIVLVWKQQRTDAIQHHLILTDLDVVVGGIVLAQQPLEFFCQNPGVFGLLICGPMRASHSSQRRRFADDIVKGTPTLVQIRLCHPPVDVTLVGATGIVQVVLGVWRVAIDQSLDQLASVGTRGVRIDQSLYPVDDLHGAFHARFRNGPVLAKCSQFVCLFHRLTSSSASESLFNFCLRFSHPPQPATFVPATASMARAIGCAIIDT